MNTRLNKFSLRGVALKLTVPCLVLLGFAVGANAGDGQIYECPTSKCIHKTLKKLKPGDTLLLEGGKRYEIAETLSLKANGTKDKRITFSSMDKTGQHRNAVITTVGGRKEEDLVGIQLTGSYWDISRIEISGKRVPLEPGYWDTNGFRLGLYLAGAAYNNISDMHIHHTHNAAVAVREISHHNTFRRMTIHHIGEWLNAGYNAHEGEGFYIGSSKGRDERGNNARAHNILIEDSVIGPGLLGQYVDLKYGTSDITVRNNIFNSFEKAYNEEIIKLAGFSNLIENNRFIGSHENLRQYVHLFNKKTKDPVLVTYDGKKNVPSPTGRDNTVINNVFYTNNADIKIILNDLNAEDRPTAVIEGNTIEPLNYLDEYTLVWQSEAKHAIWIAKVDKECNGNYDIKACKDAARKSLIQHRIDKRVK